MTSIRRKGAGLLAGVKSGRLPSEYQEVEYIYADHVRFNPPYLDLNIALEDCTKFTIHITHVRKEGPGYLFGTPKINKYSPAGTTYFRCGECNTTMNIYGGSGKPQWTFEADESTHTWLVSTDNNGVHTQESDTYTGSILSSNNIYLLYSSGKNEYGEGGYLYYADMYIDDVLVRKLIPCYRKSDNVIGMYDLCGSICQLTNTPFYINAGKGTFTKGADVN